MAQLKPNDFILILRLYYFLHRAKWKIEQKRLQQVMDWIKAPEIEGRQVHETSLTQANKIAHFTRHLAKFTIHNSKCYDQALAAKKELNRQRIPSTLLMGVNTSPIDELKAHAWVRCGEQVILGGELVPEYIALREFQ
jgi:hypothetical protein